MPFCRKNWPSAFPDAEFFTSMKTYIKIKRGLLSSAHCDAIGPAVWLFMYIIDHADWNTGVMGGYTDQEAAEELGNQSAQSDHGVSG